MRQRGTQHSPLLIFARLLGVAAALATIVLYGILLFFNPYSSEGITAGTYGVGALMGLLALVAIAGALMCKPSLLLFAFLGSFLPVGLYFLASPGIFALIGVANLLYLLAAGSMALRQYRQISD